MPSSNPPAQSCHPCPNCQTPTVWHNNSFRPFCSERCKLIDLGAWANEDYKITNQQDDIFSSHLQTD